MKIFRRNTSKETDENRSAKQKKWFAFPMKVAACAVAFGLVGSIVYTNIHTTSAQTTDSTNTALLQSTSASSSGDSQENTSSGVTAVDVSSIVEDVMPSIVAINSTYTENGEMSMLTGESEESEGAGSGIIVAQTDDTLYIATNNHVVEDADSITVTFSDDSSADATIKGTDVDNDLAVVSVNTSDLSQSTLSAIKVATLGDSDSLEAGETAIAIGNALGYGQSVTTGVISATDRELETDSGSTSTFIQTDAAINPGNSGGALINSDGEVIGINSAKFSDTSVEGMGYAIPINTAIPILNELIEKETVSEEDQGYLGISGMSVTSTVSESYDIPQGVYVSEVSEGSAAADAGIEQGDIITGFDGHSVSSMDSLKSLMQYYASGTTVDVTVERKSGNSYEEKTVSVTLQSASEGTQSAGDSQKGTESQPQQVPSADSSAQQGDSDAAEEYSQQDSFQSPQSIPENSTEGQMQNMP